MAEKTNQLPIDANQDIPRLIIRGEETITTSTSTGTWVTGSKVITVDQILSDAKPAIDVLILDNQDSNISIEREKKKYLNSLKQGLMQSLLSGKVRVELREDGLHRVGDSREANN